MCARVCEDNGTTSLQANAACVCVLPKPQPSRGRQARRNGSISEAVTKVQAIRIYLPGEPKSGLPPPRFPTASLRNCSSSIVPESLANISVQIFSYGSASFTGAGWVFVLSAWPLVHWMDTSGEAVSDCSSFSSPSPQPPAYT